MEAAVENRATSQYGQNSTSRVVPLRTRARLALDTTTVVNASNVCVAQHGASLMVAKSVRESQACSVRMSLYFNGEPREVNATAQVVSCSCVGMEGFRVSLRFTDMDEASAAALEQLLKQAA